MTSRWKLPAVMAGLWSQCFPYSLVAAIPPVNDSHRIGIVRLGLLETEESARAYRTLEKRLARWLENLNESGVRVDAAAEGAAEAAGARVERVALDLSTAVRELNAGLKAEDAADRYRRVVEKRQALAGGLDHGPSLQQALIAEARYLHATDRNREAESKLAEAIRLHPRAELPSAEGWEMEADAPDWAREMGRVRGTIRQVCQVELNVAPTEASVSWNGFPVADSAKLVLPARGEYRVVVSSPGHAAQERMVKCERSGRSVLSVKLSESNGGLAGQSTALSELTRRENVQSLVIVEPKADGFQLFLFTPGLEAEEIPMSRPLKVGELNGVPSEASLPIADDRFRLLFRKHRLAPFKVASSSDLISFPASGAEVEHSVGGTRWYAEPTFWAIMGGVAVGAAAIYFLSKGGEGSVKTQSGFSVRID